MNTQPKQIPEQNLEVFDLKKVRKESQYPVRVICAAINSVIEPLIDDPEELFFDRLGVDELAKDFIEHSNKNKPGFMSLSREIGGVSIEVLDYKKKRSHHNRLGSLILKQAGEFTSSMEGDVYTARWFIKTDRPALIESQEAA